MLIKDAGIRKLKTSYIGLFLLLCVGLITYLHPLYGNDTVRNDLYKNLEEAKHKSIQFYKEPLVYYLNISDFAASFIEIPTSIISPMSPTVASSYLAGRAALYNLAGQKVGTCSASFLNMQNADGIFTDISNYISVDNGLIVTWFTPTTLINLELDSLIHSMVTECIVTATTKVGFNPFYGQTFNLVVSSDDQKIYFQFTRTGAIF